MVSETFSNTLFNKIQHSTTMAPHADSIISSPYSARSSSSSRRFSQSQPQPLPISTIHRTMSDLSFELSKEAAHAHISETTNKNLAPISEAEDIKCECCGMSEECTPEYIERIRSKFAGKWICGLCSEAVKEEVMKNGGKKEEALNTHMAACARFNKFSRAYPILCQAEAMREMLKKNGREGLRAKSMNPRTMDNGKGQKKAGIARSSSCMPAITREIEI